MGSLSSPVTLVACVAFAAVTLDARAQPAPQPGQPQPAQPAQPTPPPGAAQPAPAQPPAALPPTQPQSSSPAQPQPAQPQPAQPQTDQPALPPGQLPPEAVPARPSRYYDYQPRPAPPPSEAPPPSVRAPPPEESSCCRFAVRFDPFDLLFRKLSFQGEVAIWGPFSVEIEPTWIFGSPSEGVDASGFDITGSVAFYFTGKAPQGFFLKAIVEYERFTATVTNPGNEKLTKDGVVASPILGGVLGSSTIFGKNWGFNISGSIGIGVATAGSTTITAPGKGNVQPFAVRFYDKGSTIQLLGSLGLGIGF